MSKVIQLYPSGTKERIFFASIFFNDVYSYKLRVIRSIPKNCNFIPSRFKAILVKVDQDHECMHVLIKHYFPLDLAEKDFKKSCFEAGCTGANLQQYDLPKNVILQIYNASI